MDKRYLLIIPILAITIIVIASNMPTDSLDTYDKENIKKDNNIVPEYFGESGWDLESMSRHAKYIVIGRVLDYNALQYKINEINEQHANVVIEIERELTGSYNNTIISYRSMDYGWIDEGDKVLVFLADKEPDSIWGNNYYPIGGMKGLYKIIDNKVYGQDLRDGLELGKVIAKIEKYRNERLKLATTIAKYIVIGKIDKVIPINDDPNNLIADVIINVEEELTGSYTSNTISFRTYNKDLWMKEEGNRYLLFIRDDLPEVYDNKYHVGRLYAYKIIDNIAYGPEYPEGMPLDKAKMKIMGYKTAQ